MTDYGLVNSGFIIKDLATIENDIETRLKDKLGNGVNTRSQSVFGSLRDISANDNAELWEKMQDVWNQLNPATATGYSLDILALISGKTRLAATYAKIRDFSLTTTGAVSLAAGTTFSVEGNEDIKFALDSAFATTSAGTFFANVTCTTAGKLEVEDDTVTVIDSPVANLDSVNNFSTNSKYNDGRDEETDAELRARIQASPTTTQTGTLEGIRNAVLNLNNTRTDLLTIIDCLVIENDRLTTDAEGRPGKSIEVIVYYEPIGADEATDEAIAEAIGDNKTEGTQTVSTGNSVEKLYGDGVTASRYIYFSRPSEQSIYCTIKAKKTNDQNLSTSEKSLLTDEIVSYGSALGLGGDVIVYGKNSLSDVLNDFTSVDLIDYEIGVSTSASPTPGTDTRNITIDKTTISRWYDYNIEIEDF